MMCLGFRNGIVAVYQYNSTLRDNMRGILRLNSSVPIVGLHPYHHDNKIIVSGMNSQVYKLYENNKCNTVNY